jgi:hypothetical protein
LLRSCGYANLHPTNNVADAEKRSHLHFTFAEPRHVEVHVGTSLAPEGKIGLDLTEVAITLPLSSGIILVRSNQDTLYFAKFDCKVASELEATLKKAQTP